MIDELWRPIPGMGGFYDASTHGRIRSWHNRHGGKSDSPHLMTPKPSKTGGYMCVRIRIGSQYQGIRRVHQLVLEAFIGPRPTRNSQTRHLDGDRRNNRLDNLAWGTQIENEEDKLRHGTLLRGESHPNAIVSAEIVRAIRAEYDRQKGVRGTCKALADTHGIDIRLVHKIALRKSWRHIADNAA